MKLTRNRITKSAFALFALSAVQVGAAPVEYHFNHLSAVGWFPFDREGAVKSSWMQRRQYSAANVCESIYPNLAYL